VTAVLDVLRIAAAALLVTALVTYAMKLKRGAASIFDERHRPKPGWVASGLILALVIVGDVVSLIDL